MGYVDDIKAMNLSDEVTDKLLRAHQAEVDPLRTRAESAESRDRRERVKAEIVALSDAGFKEAPAALAYVRRVFLSPDADEAGAVLLADHELGLSGDEATGATAKEDVSAAKVLRTFFELLPKDKDGKLKISLSDQGLAADDHDKPDDGDDTPEKRTAGHKKSLGTVLGREIKRDRKRYGGSVVSGGAD